MATDRVRCRCARCTIRSLMGPAVVITIGVLFLLQETRSGSYGFDNTYPFILVVIGAIMLASSLAPSEGHVSTETIPPAAPNSVPPPPGPPAPPQNSYPGQG
jgi:hypothetical protein